MALYIIGLGLGSEKDITEKGLEAVRNCNFVYIDTYTSILPAEIKKLEDFYGKKLIPATREIVEKQAEEEMLKKAVENDVAFLVVGDVFSATTHVDLALRARKAGIKVHLIHNASILTAIGDTGLSLYKFGKTASIPFENKDIEAPYDVLKENAGMHTLFLLDLKVEENKTMSAKEAVDFLLGVEEKRKEKFFTEETMCVACARLGFDDEEIAYGTAKQIMKEKISKFPQCLIVPGKLHFMEEEYLKGFEVK
ncbi:MAG: diphthine synthase [Candidatus Nanoarchaeia archaeon]|jgi:diphthine synthase